MGRVSQRYVCCRCSTRIIFTTLLVIAVVWCLHQINEIYQYRSILPQRLLYNIEIHPSYATNYKTIDTYNTSLSRADWYFMSAYLDQREYPLAHVTLFALRQANSTQAVFKCTSLSTPQQTWKLEPNIEAEEAYHYDWDRAAGVTRTLTIGPFELKAILSPSSTIYANISIFSTKYKGVYQEFVIRLSHIPPLQEIKPKYNFSICVAPAFGYLSVDRYIGFIELNRILGAQHFYLYDYTAGEINPQLKQIWRYYESQSVVSVRPWILPRLYQDSDVYYHLQLLNIHHCLYRAILESKYTLFYDLDEVLVPATVTAWPQLVKQMGFHDADMRCCICFLMAFFIKNPQQKGAIDKPPYFTDTISTQHHNDIGKCITQTAFMYDMNVHGPKRCIGGGHYLHIVNGSVALIHHYYQHYCSRPGNMNNKNMCKLRDEPNSNLLKYEDEFFRRVEVVRERLRLNISWVT